jgi:hypothetical protein
MRVTDIGELTDHDTYWNLAYDGCSHVQAFARQGLDDPEAAVFFVRRHYAQCLTCIRTNRPVAAETLNVEPDQFHLVFSLDELTAIVSALRSSDRPDLADRLDKVLRQPGRAHYP